MAKGIDPDYSDTRLDGMLTLLERVAAGDYTATYTVSKNNDRFDALGVAVNMMIDDIKTNIETVENDRDFTDNIVNSMSDTLVVLDPEGTIRQVNQVTLDLLGYEREQLIGRQIDSVIENEELIPKKGILRNVEKRYLTKDGRKIPILYSGSMLRDNKGEIIDRICLGKDITERKKAQDVLRQAHEGLEIQVKNRTADLSQVNKALQDEIKERMLVEEELRRYATELERSNQTLQQFAYVASHDLQEPLRTVTSYVQLTERNYKGRLDSDAEDFIELIVEGAKRMKELVAGLLAYSRVGSHGETFKITDSEAILNQALGNLAVAVKESNAVVNREPVPEIMADGTQLTQVFQNLIGNAIKFSGSHQPEIRIRAKAGKGEWIFLVQDNGVGFEQQYHDRIFKIFQHLHKREEYPGTGIGLAICKRIVERHGGRIWANSEPAKGSTFYFSIPKSREQK